MQLSFSDIYMINKNDYTLTFAANLKSYEKDLWDRIHDDIIAGYGGAGRQQYGKRTGGSDHHRTVQTTIDQVFCLPGSHYFKRKNCETGSGQSPDRFE